MAIGADRKDSHWLSGLWTFFFGFLYLQDMINKIKELVSLRESQDLKS